MAIPILNNLDLKGNQLIAALLEQLAADPTTPAPVEARVWYDTVLKKVRFRDDAGSRSLMREDTRLDQIAAPTADVALNNQQITNLAAGVDASDAVTKAQLDALAAGLSWKESVRVASTGNYAIMSGLPTVDGVVTVDGDRILLKNQSDATENGIYVVGTGLDWTRTTDAESGADLVGATMFVEEGASLEHTIWVLSTNAPITVDADNLTFVQFAAGGSPTAGAGLSLAANVYDVNVDNSSIEISSDSLRVKAAGITNAMLAGAIDLAAKVTGLLAIANGGTGASTAAGARTALGATTKFAADITGDAAAVQFTVTHNLGTTDVIVNVWEVTTNALVMVDVVRTSTNAVRIDFAVAPANAKVYRVVVIA